MRTVHILVCLVFLSLTSTAQRYSCRDGKVQFYSHAPLEDIRATNDKVQSVFNAETGEIAFRVRISDFQFRKKLMQEHFNEKYMESDKYPGATFSGKLSGFSMQKTGDQSVRAQGKLTIHGVTRDIDVPGTLTVDKDVLRMKSVFMVKLNDYNITIPQVLWQNIAEEIEVTIEPTYKKN